MSSLRIILYFLLSLSSFAEDFGVALPDQLGNSEENTFGGEENKEFEAHIMGFEGEADFSFESNSKGKAYSIPDQGVGEVPSPSEKEKLLSPDNSLPFSFEKRENILKFKNSSIYNNHYDQGEGAFSFSYIKDSYTLGDSRNIYEASYIRAKKALRGGFLHFNFDRYLNRSFLSLFYGAGLGVGFSRGEGLFVNSTSTPTGVTFQLFMVPLDFRMGTVIGYGKYIRLSIAGGPTVMGLLQSRSDKEKGEEDKHKRQVSYGYFGHIRFQASITSLFSGLAFKSFHQYQMTNMYLNLEARYHNYQNFQDNITIDGSSFGLGFTFEYL